MERADRLFVGLALLALYVIWGSTYFGMRIALEGYPPFAMGAIRFALAGGALFLLMKARGAPMPTRRQWLNSAMVGTLLLPLGNGLVGVAEQWVASSMAAVMVASMPLWAALFSGLFGKWPAMRDRFGLLLGAVGVVLLNLDGDLRASAPGAIALLVSPMCWAFGSVWSKRLDLPKGPMASAAQMLCGSVVFALLSVRQWGDVHPTTRSTAALLYLAVFGSLIAFSAYQFLLVTVKPSLATSYAYVNPVVALLLGVAVGGEKVTAYGFAGTGVIVAAVLLVVLKFERRRAGAAIPAAAAAER